MCEGCMCEGCMCEECMCEECMCEECMCEGCRSACVRGACVRGAHQCVCFDTVLNHKEEATPPRCIHPPVSSWRLFRDSVTALTEGSVRKSQEKRSNEAAGVETIHATLPTRHTMTQLVGQCTCITVYRQQ